MDVSNPFVKPRNEPVLAQVEPPPTPDIGEDERAYAGPVAARAANVKKILAKVRAASNVVVQKETAMSNGLTKSYSATFSMLRIPDLAVVRVGQVEEVRAKLKRARGLGIMQAEGSPTRLVDEEALAQEALASPLASPDKGKVDAIEAHKRAEGFRGMRRQSSFM